MEDTRKRGVTEFLKREMQAWETIAVTDARRTDRHRRRWLMIIAAVSAFALVLALCIWLVPRAMAGDRTPAPGEGEQEGGLPPAEQESTNESESDTMPNPGQTGPEPEADPYAYDFSVVPAGATPIVPRNLATGQLLINQTDRAIDMQEIRDAVCRVPAVRGQVSVLILHTHTGEGYNENDAAWLEAGNGEFARSYDAQQSVVAMGAELAAALNAAGIGTVHCKTVFDGSSNRESYLRAADAIRAFCKAYPSLVCVIDVHRSAATDQEGNIVRSMAVRGEQKIAQTQMICGMSAGDASKTNLALALSLCERMNAAFPDSCAGVICKEQIPNADLLPFSLTLEIGSCGNTPGEAKAAAKIAAAALSPLFDLH